MRDELVKCSWGYEEMLTFLFRELLLTRMSRRGTELRIVFGRSELSGDNAVGVALIGLERYLSEKE